MSDYDPAADAFAGFTLWTSIQRHRLLVSGDAFARDDEVIDLFIVWMIGSAR